MDLIEAAKQIRLAVGAHDVTGRQDLEKPFAVSSLDHILLDDDEVSDRRIDGDDLLVELQVFQVKATLAQSISSLEQARATLQHNETQLEYNRVNLECWRTMKERDLFAQQDLDDRQVLVKSGQADVDAARANVAAAEANVNANKANVERIINLQSFRKVRAPFAGVIAVRNVDSGALITAGSGSDNQPLFRMAQIA